MTGFKDERNEEIGLYGQTVNGKINTMERRKFIKQSAIGAGSLLTIPSIVYGGNSYQKQIISESGYTPISQIKKPLAIAMWEINHQRFWQHTCQMQSVQSVRPEALGTNGVSRSHIYALKFIISN